MTTDEKTRISPGRIVADVGTRLSGIYELDKRIASGGMGEVFRGHNIETGDEVAIKIVLPEFALDQMILSLFRKEASILNHLSHEAVVRYHVFTIDPDIGRPYLAMEFVDGESLIEVIRRGPMATTDVATLCHRLASALSAVHQAGAIHRDLSPDNIILPAGRVERAKIIDFGIARSSTIGGATLIGGNFAGKYNYVSPEQLGLFGGRVQEQSDIYSLGLVIAAALLGKPLDMAGSQYEVIEKRRVVPDLGGIAVDFRPILNAMLQPDPADRPQTMDAVALAMDGLGKPAETTWTPASGYPDLTATPEESSSDEPWVSAFASEPNPLEHSRSTTSPKFVAHESGLRPAERRTTQSPRLRNEQPSPVPRRRGLRLAMGIAMAIVVLGTGVGIYASGYLEQPVASAPEQTTVAILTPEIPSGADSAPGQTTDRSETSADTREPALGPGKNGTADRVDPPGKIDRHASTGDTDQQQGRDGPARIPTQDQDVALNVPNPPQQPSDAIDGVTSQISWLRDYKGGDCFYASVTSATDKDIDIEGFGTAVEPFEKMLNAFKATFGIEPDVSVRQITAPQCEVTRLMAALDGGETNKPKFSVDRTTLRNGTTLNGQLETTAGLRSSLLLIDQNGMTSNVDARVTVQGGKALLKLPVAANERGKVLDGAPQIILVVTGPANLRSAELPKPTPAEIVIPKILAEIEATHSDFAATAKYLRVGG